MSDSRFMVLNEEERVVAIFMFEKDAEQYTDMMSDLLVSYTIEEILVEDVHEYF